MLKTPAPLAVALGALILAGAASALDPNELAEAQRHLAIVRKEAGILTRLAASSAPASDPSSDPHQVSAALVKAVDALEASLNAEPRGDLEQPYQEVEEAADAVEPALPYFPPKGGARSRLSNVRWSLGRISHLIGLESDASEKFSVGPVSREQAETLLVRIATLLDRSVELTAGLQAAPPALMYRDLLISQLKAFIDPAATLKVTAKGNPPWWTPEAYKAVTQIVRLVALTKNETRKLTPPLLEALKKVWTASEELEAAANDIEQGARASGSDAQIEYQPVPGSH